MPGSPGLADGQGAVILITGVQAAGKSTAAETTAEILARAWTEASVD
jgi:adenylylsulfate kinase-like enzyme